MPEELLVSVVEAARRLGVGRSKIYELMGAGELKSLHVGKLRRVVVADLMAFVERRLASEGANSAK
ncbi:MAG: helix-turn-helix domain-containing protein [Chloroflexota bacterium]|nr:helix-turn-helix domain-containing protein [Chloroflexota bacterium]